jgi:probable HAF family extracellular repeat protein
LRRVVVLLALALTGCGGSADGDMGQSDPVPAYGIVDIGTLGGTWTIPGGINALGEATGTSELLDGSWQAFIWRAGLMEGLGTLGGSISWGNAINDSGQVTGSSPLADECPDEGLWRCGPETFLWNGSEMIQRERSPQDEALFTDGRAINLSGQVLGQGSDDAAEAAFLWEGATTAWITDESLPNGFRTQGNAINDAGQVVGVFDLTATELAFIWDPATTQMRELGTFGGFLSSANDINASGIVVGYANTEFDRGQFLAFIWQGTTLVELGTLGGNHSVAHMINEVNQVAGVSLLPGDFARHAFLWQDSNMQDLGTLGGSESFPLAISNAGEIVGYSYTNDDENVHAFVWDGNSMKDLNRLVSPARLGNARLRRSEDINDSGQILASGLSADGEERVYVLTPILVLFDRLQQQVADVEPSSLGGEITNARSYFEARDVKAACTMLVGVKRQLSALPVRLVSSARAQQLSEETTAILEALDCP